MRSSYAVDSHSVIRKIVNTDLTFIVYAIILVPFFEPMCLQYLSGSIIEYIETIFSILRIGISVIAILFLNIKMVKGNELLLCSFFFMVASMLINSGFVIGMRQAVPVFCYIGLISTLSLLAERNYRAAINGLIAIFLSYYLVSLYTVFILPHGLKFDAVTDSTIYFFGGKNSIFLWTLPLVVLLISRQRLKYEVIQWGVIALLGLNCCVSFFVDSASSAFMFGASAIALILIKLNPKSRVMGVILNPKLLAVIVLVVFFVVVLANRADIFSYFLEMMDRSTTLTGRTVLWEQALVNTSEHPLFGVGQSYEYALAGGVITSHPHSFYLQYAASFGLPFILLFVLDIFFCMSKSKGSNMLPGQLAIAFLFFILLLHSCFDVIVMYIYLLMRFVLLRSLDDAISPLGNNRHSQSNISNRRRGHFDLYQ